MIKLQGVNVVFHKTGRTKNTILQNLNLNIKDGEFVTVIGGNGAGKSTLMNVISGNIIPNKGKVYIDNIDVTETSVEDRSRFVSRVFQDPMIGTFSNLTIEENMSIALKRGTKRGIRNSSNAKLREKFRESLSVVGIGLEDRLSDKVLLLSGGQRQALSLIMANLVGSKILLLDEHTAALDPKIAKNVMELTQKIVKIHNLTVLMITHSMSQALSYGDRTIMMYHGNIVRDMRGADRDNLSSADLIKYFDYE